MSRAALKRVERLVLGATPVSSAIVKVNFGDIRAVVALAKRAEELERIARTFRIWLTEFDGVNREAARDLKRVDKVLGDGARAKSRRKR